MIRPVYPDRFYHEGRGPELRRVYWDHGGIVLRAIDYYNPDAVHDPQHLSHVRFVGPQVVMITPEEVIDYGTNGAALVDYRPAALFDLGRSPWLASFAQRHLAGCRHWQLYFYDQLVDVICERVECLDGAYRPDGERHPHDETSA